MSLVLQRLLLEATWWLRGAHSLSLLHQIAPTPELTREQALAMQFDRLSTLLTHAEHHVPYYREMFRTLGATSRDIKTLDDFACLPVLTKRIVRERQKDLVSDVTPRHELVAQHTGGSTGVPLTFYFDGSTVDASEAAVFRQLQRSGWRPGEMVALFWGWPDRLYAMSRWEFELRQVARRMYQFNAFRAGPSDLDRWCKRWSTLGATVAFGYPSTLCRFAEHIERRGIHIASLRGVFVTGESFPPEQRQLLSRVFGCQVYNCYGSSEIRNIAAECCKGRMHINVDYVVLETESGTTGAGAPPFIVTSLVNFAMPFIRYRNDDAGTVLEGDCACGSGFPLMCLDVSRANDYFVLADGTLVHGLFFTYLMYGSEGIAAFQFHQTSVDAITLWVVPEPGKAAARERVLKNAVDKIRGLSSTPILVDVREVNEIPLSHTGKHVYTRSDVEPRTATF